MIGFIKILQKRPSDKTIRISRILFGLLLILAWYYNLIYQGDSLENTVLWMDISAIEIYVKYGIISLWIIPLFMWASNLCLLKKKYMKIVSIIFGILLFFISSIIIESAHLDFDTLVWFMWIFPLIWWITGKCIPSHCLRYKEKITKIRV